MARFCNYCGVALEAPRYGDSYDRQQETKDIAHPINQEFRAYMEKKVLDAYDEEVKNVPHQESDTGAVKSEEGI